MLKASIDKNQSPYALLAGEYYSKAHKTSRNFDLATRETIGEWRIENSLVRSVELGAGCGRVGEFLGVGPDHLVQVDISAEMLQVKPREECFIRVRCDARNTPFLDNSFDLAAAFLFDPFNDESLYHEVYRLLDSGGIFIATLPSLAWGSLLRCHLNLPIDQTRFYTSSGEVILAPSFLSSPSEIVAHLVGAGFTDIDVRDGYLPTDTEVVSPDIILAADAAGKSVDSIPIISALRAVK